MADTAKDLPPKADTTGQRGMLTQVGAAGTKIFSGLVLDDYNPDLQGIKAVPVYDKMRRSEPMVQAVLLACELPIRSARWYIEPASEKPMHVALADFIHDALFNFGDQTFDDFCRLGLGMLWAGFSWLEKDFAYDERGYLMWQRFAYRHQNTVWRWNMDPNDLDRLDSILQLAPPTYEFHTVPADKSLIYSFRQEGNNFQGISMLRAAYKPWFILDYLTKVANVGYERMAGGLPVVRIPDGAEKALIDQAVSIVENLRMGDEQAGLTLPHQLEFLILEIGGKMMDHLNAYLEQQRLQITRSALASFMNMPGSNVGSFALSKDQSQLFLDSLSATADQFAEVFNLRAIPQLLNLNFRGLKLEDMPKLEHARIGQRDVRWLGRSLGELAKNDLLTPDPELETRIREILDLPDLPEEQSGEPVNNPPASEFERLQQRGAAGQSSASPQDDTPVPSNLPAAKVIASQRWRPSTRLRTLRAQRAAYEIRRLAEAPRPRSRTALNELAHREENSLTRLIKTSMHDGRENAKKVLAQQNGA